MHRVLTGVVIAAVGFSLAACESTSDSGSEAKGVTTVNVQLTEKGCTPARIEVAAGPTTFHVNNDGADDVTEFEVLDGGKILGEKENLTPGLSGKFTLTLKEGNYVTYCPGGSPNERGSLAVGASATTQKTTPQDEAAVQQAVANYKTYVARETAQLVAATTAFADAVKGARAAFDAVEPIVASRDPELATQVPTDFATVLASLQPYRRGDGFVSYDTLSKADTRKLAAAVDTLADELAKVPPLVVLQK